QDGGWGGALDEIRFYNRALTDTELQALFSPVIAGTNIGVCATAAVVYSAITNGGFEAGLAGWSYNAGVYSIGHFGTEPIGVDGSLAADLGGGEIAGSKMWQSITVVPQTPYQLTFSEAANGAGFAGLTAVGKAEIEDSHGTILAALRFTNISPTHILGTTGFVAHTLPF